MRKNAKKFSNSFLQIIMKKQCKLINFLHVIYFSLLTLFIVQEQYIGTTFTHCIYFSRTMWNHSSVTRHWP